MSPQPTLTRRQAALAAGVLAAAAIVRSPAGTAAAIGATAVLDKARIAATAWQISEDAAIAFVDGDESGGRAAEELLYENADAAAGRWKAAMGDLSATPARCLRDIGIKAALLASLDCGNLAEEDLRASIRRDLWQLVGEARPLLRLTAGEWREVEA
jgi:hypothetical protein